jgi:diacylglycerol kinase (ATP)
VRSVVICNPLAGKQDGERNLQLAIDVLERAGWSVCVHRTEAAGHATTLARQAVTEGVDTVLVAGGDGTLNEVIQALVGTETAVGTLPFGTVNVWARELGMPLQPVDAARAIVGGHTVRIDLGMVNNRYFLLMAGIGFDGEAVSRAATFTRYKRHFGILPYIAAGLITAFRFPGADVELRYDGLIRRMQALQIVAGNTRLYGGAFRFTPRAVATDGLLDVCVVKGHGPLAVLRQSLPILLSGTIARVDVEMLRVRELTVRTDRVLAMQVDGEWAGTTPVDFRVAPRSLTVIVPHGFTSDLIA